MRLRPTDYVALAIVAVLIYFGPPAGTGFLPVRPQPIRLVVVENALVGTAASDAVLSAIQAYAEANQGGRYRCLDVEKTRDREGKIPAGYEAEIADFQGSGGESPRLSILVHATDKPLWRGPIPTTPADAVALAKKYGG
ncbi:MAG: hypothetical protein LLG00_11615 [Planctomycetaceae bacterium]|nr:hypothetical protein [Planctomycetaceae bacterium]